jgi:probable F420-dependent oxidoreductase
MKIGIGLFTGQIPKNSKRTLHEEYRDIIEMTKTVETAGLDAAWVSEHHFSEDNYLPSLLVMLSAMAAATERIELGTGVVLAPFHDPIRLAEDYAVVDQISNGRVICGLGIGWRDEEFREFNISTKSRVRRLEEVTEILRLAWNEDRFSFSGRHYSYDRVAVTPKPARVPPILIGGFVDAAIRRAGRIGDGYISSRAQPERVAESFAMASEEREGAGKSGPPIAAVLINAYVTEEPDRDWAMVRDGIGHQLGVYAGWRNGTDLPGVPLEVAPPDEETIRNITPYGTPDDVVEQLKPTVEALLAYPESHLVVRLHYPGMDLEPGVRAIELFGREVAPRLRKMEATRR